MKVYGLFCGNSGSWGPPSIPEDLEAFDSIKEAKDALWRRVDGYEREFPCVDERAEMQLFFEKPDDNRDPYPDRIVYVGPRGGIHVVSC